MVFYVRHRLDKIAYFAGVFFLHIYRKTVHKISCKMYGKFSLYCVCQEFLMHECIYISGREILTLLAQNSITIKVRAVRI